MAYYPFAPETGAKYTLTSPDGVTATFNDPFDPNYVGMLAEVTGLDSADVRESADDLVEADGGQHGYFWLGRRPIVLNGRVFGHSSVAQRAARLDRGRRASFALRGDSTLSWKPSTRSENPVLNPSFEIDTTNWAAAGSGLNAGSTLTRVTSQFQSGVASGQVTTTTASGFQGIIAAVPGTFVAGQTYTFSVYLRGNAGAELVHLWFGATTGMGNGVNATNSSNFSLTTGWVRYTVQWTPTTTTSAASIMMRYPNGTGVVGTYYVDSAMVSNGSVAPTYFDGDTAGYYWQGNAHASASGDFIEMYTPVRRQQPWRESGNWNKDFQCALVSQYAPLFSVQQKSVTANLAVGATVENRGSYAAYPVINITGGGLSNPTVTRTGGEVFTTAGQGLTIASGETLQVDFLNHTAKFTAGARNGQSGNRYINFASTQWPSLPAGNNTLTLGGTGTGSMTVFWRDTWA